MPNPSKYRIGPWEFPTKELVRRRAQEILLEQRPGNDLLGAELAFMLALLDRHPRRAEKVGSGVATLFIRRNGMGQNEFAIRRTDGAADNFSYEKCLAPLSPNTEIGRAFRREIHAQLIIAGWVVASGDDITKPGTTFRAVQS